MTEQTPGPNTAEVAKVEKQIRKAAKKVWAKHPNNPQLIGDVLPGAKVTYALAYPNLLTTPERLDLARSHARLQQRSDVLLEAHRESLRKLDALDRRLVGRRPHPNDISWAKQISQDIRKLAQVAISMTEPE